MPLTGASIFVSPKERIENSDLTNGRLLSEENTKKIKEFFEINKNENKIKKLEQPLQLPYSVIRTDSGQLLAIYHSELGRGAFAKVKIAQNIETGEWVAIKVEEVKNNSKRSKNLKRIQNEQSIQGDAGIFFGGQIRNKTKSLTKSYSVMPIITGLEFVRGQRKFQEAVQNANNDEISGLALLSINMALSTTEHLARLHGKNIIHRDLHLGNILVDENGHSTIIDYGCSLRLDEKTKTKKASVKGHYAYYSEDLKRDFYKSRKHTYTTKEDLFALGKCIDEFKVVDILRRYGSVLGFSDRKIEMVISRLEALKSEDPNTRPEASELVPILKEIKDQINLNRAPQSKSVNSHKSRIIIGSR